MKKKVLRHLKGYLKIRARGVSLERFLNLCSYQNLKLWNVTFQDDCYEMNISVEDFRKIRLPAKKTKTQVKILEREGFPFFIYKYQTRYFFALGFILFSLLLVSMTGMIWDIKIEENSRYSDEEIIQSLSEINISIGKRKKDISCDQISDVLREQFPEIIWVSSSMDGVVLEIHIKEKLESVAEKTEPDISSPADLVADRQGTVFSMITSQGVPQVSVGDEVNVGDVLVSGTIPIHNDAKEIVDYQYCVAEAEIRIRREYSYEDYLDKTYYLLTETGNKTLQIWAENEHRICTLGKKNNDFEYYKTYAQSDSLKLAEVYGFPMRIGYQITKECKRIEKTYSVEEARQILSLRFQRFCQNLEKKGVQILSNNVKIYDGIERVSAEGFLVLEESIGIQIETEEQKIPDQDKIS